jgi:hypothetical protein
VSAQDKTCKLKAENAEVSLAPIVTDHDVGWCIYKYQCLLLYVDVSSVCDLQWNEKKESGSWES